MKRRFRTNSTPRADDSTPVEYDAEYIHIEPYRKKDKSGRVWEGLIMLPADTPVKSGDQVFYGDRWFSLNHFEPVDEVGGRLDHYEVYF